MPPENTQTGNTSPMTGLLPFLRHARQQLLHLPASRVSSSSPSSASLSKTPVLVLGNQSADLDSIISAIVYSYFFSRAGSNNGNNRRLHAPVINLPDVPSGAELRRLRPEFACAFELATTTTTSSSSTSRSEKASSAKDDHAVQLLNEHILTVADLREQLLLSSHQQQQQPGSGTETGKLELDAVLVDWNKPSHHEEGKVGQGSVDGLHDLATFSVTGCIDHHADEGFVPAAEALPEGNLRVIELGPGSCTSVIIREVQRRGLWSSSSSSSSSLPRGTTEHYNPSNIGADDVDVQIAKLALAAILIDTGNLTAEGKVTEVDREAVSFLSQKILDALGSGSSGDLWNQRKFFDEIQHAKTHSLDWLTVHETLGRDYKDWTESTASPSTNKITIGIASVVRPLSWIISKANDEEKGERKDRGTQNQGDLNTLLAKLKDFAQQKGLDVVSVMTAFSSGEDDRFQRELLVWGLHDGCTAQLETFIESNKEQLQLAQWTQFPFEGRAEGVGRLCIWRQGSVRSSRKQVAPLLRKVYSGSRSTHI